jgi:hypothetical protein
LKPKTVDPNAPKTEAPSYVAAASIFGAAKPVDTASKEREIEEKLLAKHETKAHPSLSAASSLTNLNEVSDDKLVNIFNVLYIYIYIYISNLIFGLFQLIFFVD